MESEASSIIMESSRSEYGIEQIFFKVDISSDIEDEELDRVIEENSKLVSSSVGLTELRNVPDTDYTQLDEELNDHVLMEKLNQISKLSQNNDPDESLETDPAEFSNVICQKLLGLNYSLLKDAKEFELILLKKIADITEKIVELQKELLIKSSKRNHNKFEKWGQYFTFYRNYFVDQDKFPCRYNSDVTAIQKTALIPIHLPEFKRWNANNLTDLNKSVAAHIIDCKEKELEALKRQYAGRTSREIRDKLAKFEEQIARLHTMATEDVLLFADHVELNWEKIAVKLFKDSTVRSGDECKRMWKLNAAPHINNRIWTAREEKKLFKIAQKNKFQNWEKIAQELNTSRTGFRCFLHFQMKFGFKKNPQWTKREDQHILSFLDEYKYVQHNRHIPLTQMAIHLPNKTFENIQKRIRYMKIEFVKRTVKKGQFTKYEMTIMEDGIRQGLSYKTISEFLGNRSQEQVRVKLQTKYDPMKKKLGTFSQDEDLRLLSLVETYGVKSWSLIAKKLKTRDRTQCRHRYNNIIQNIKTHKSFKFNKALEDKDLLTNHLNALQQNRKRRLEEEKYFTPEVCQRNRKSLEDLLSTLTLPDKFKQKRKRKYTKKLVLLKEGDELIINPANDSEPCKEEEKLPNLKRPLKVEPSEDEDYDYDDPPLSKKQCLKIVRPDDLLHEYFDESVREHSLKKGAINSVKLERYFEGLTLALMLKILKFKPSQERFKKKKLCTYKDHWNSTEYKFIAGWAQRFFNEQNEDIDLSQKTAKPSEIRVGTFDYPASLQTLDCESSDEEQVEEEPLDCASVAVEDEDEDEEEGEGQGIMASLASNSQMIKSMLSYSVNSFIPPSLEILNGLKPIKVLLQADQSSIASSGQLSFDQGSSIVVAPNSECEVSSHESAVVSDQPNESNSRPQSSSEGSLLQTPIHEISFSDLSGFVSHIPSGQVFQPSVSSVASMAVTQPVQRVYSPRNVNLKTPSPVTRSQNNIFQKPNSPITPKRNSTRNTNQPGASRVSAFTQPQHYIDVNDIESERSKITRSVATLLSESEKKPLSKFEKATLLLESRITNMFTASCLLSEPLECGSINRQAHHLSQWINKVSNRMKPSSQGTS